MGSLKLAEKVAINRKMSQTKAQKTQVDTYSILSC